MSVLQLRFELSDDTYEVCFNHASYLIGQREYEQASAKLQEAESELRIQNNGINTRDSFAIVVVLLFRVVSGVFRG